MFGRKRRHLINVYIFYSHSVSLPKSWALYCKTCDMHRTFLLPSLRLFVDCKKKEAELIEIENWTAPFIIVCGIHFE